jgi:tetratricopeptide (TPR) repeat protein
MYRKIKNTEPRQMLIEEAGKCFCLAGNLYALMGKYHTARQNFDEARALVQENGSVLSKANVYRSMTHLSLRENDFEEALRQGALLMEQVALMGNPTAKFPAMALIAEAEFGLGRVDKAISLTIECIDGYVKHKDTMRYCKQLTNLSLYYSTSQEYAKARAAAEESLKISRNEGGVVLWSCLQIWCLLGALNDRLKDAATLAGFLEAKQRNSAEVRASIELLAYTQIMNVLDTKLSTFETESCMARGATFTEAQAVSFTLKQLVASVSIPREQGQGPGFPLLEGRAE